MHMAILSLIFDPDCFSSLPVITNEISYIRPPTTFYYETERNEDYFLYFFVISESFSLRNTTGNITLFSTSRTKMIGQTHIKHT